MVGAFPPGQQELLHGADGAGLVLADARRRVADVGERAIGIAHPNGRRIVQGAVPFVTGFFIPHARQHMEPIAEQPELRLHVDAGHRFADPV
jgi:hypothetical protein